MDDTSYLVGYLVHVPSTSPRAPNVAASSFEDTVIKILWRRGLLMVMIPWSFRWELKHGKYVARRDGNCPCIKEMTRTWNDGIACMYLVVFGCRIHPTHISTKSSSYLHVRPLAEGCEGWEGLPGYFFQGPVLWLPVLRSHCRTMAGHGSCGQYASIQFRQYSWFVHCTNIMFRI